MPKQKPVNKGGRPTKYTEDYPDKVYTFIDKCKKEDIIPFKVDLCVDMGLNEEDISKYSKRYPRFNKAIQMLNKESERALLQKGLHRKVDPNFARFILAANYGYVETSKTINEGKNEPVIIRLDMSGGYVPPISANAPNRLIDKDKQHN